MTDPQQPQRNSRGRIAVIDDDAAMLLSLKRILGFNGFEVIDFTSASAAIEAIKPNPSSFDTILTDLNMPGVDGLSLMRSIKEIDKDAVIVVLTGFPSAENAISALRNGAFDFLEKPYSNEILSLTLDKGVELRHLRKSLEDYHKNLENMLEIRSRELRNTLSRLNEAYMNTMEVIVALLELKEAGTAQHSIRVGRRTAHLAALMGIKQGSKELESIRRGALLHDIGKIGIPDSILNKPAKLDEEEMLFMKRHPQIGHDIVSTIPEMEAAAEIVLSHHERFDGKGYPRALAGTDICIGARIFSVIDAYDAIRFDRCYRKGTSMEESLAEIEKASGTQFAPDVVEAFKVHIEEIDKG